MRGCVARALACANASCASEVGLCLSVDNGPEGVDGGMAAVQHVLLEVNPISGSEGCHHCVLIIGQLPG